MRGTLDLNHGPLGYDGIIPAYAGNTADDHKQDRFRRDHPRVCGEHLAHERVPPELFGSSPRMRGTQIPPLQGVFSFGIIPAYAGNTPVHNSLATRRRDHPRVCGEHHHQALPKWLAEGSSPRMRGTLLIMTNQRKHDGIIPAYAGNTISRSSSRASNWDHPRVCGEHDKISHDVPCRAGSSPRMRGTLSCGQSWRAATGIIPAYAGNTKPC